MLDVEGELAVLHLLAAVEAVAVVCSTSRGSSPCSTCSRPSRRWTPWPSRGSSPCSRATCSTCSPRWASTWPAVVKLAAVEAELAAIDVEGELAPLAVLDVAAVAGDGIAVEAVDALAVEGELAVLHLLAAVVLAALDVPRDVR